MGTLALTKTREVESGVRTQLRVLQLAQLEGWEVAQSYTEVLKRATKDPLIMAARRRAAKEKSRMACDKESVSETESENDY